MKLFSTALITLTIATIGFTAASADEVTKPVAGTFSGASEHITTGGVQIVKTADGGAVVILDSNFSLDGAPDPRVGFGKDGVYAEAADLGELQNLTGVQVYIVPASVNVDDFNEVYIWCLEFGVPLGVAQIS
ncbi:DM13 domain-containing protein [Yoonia sp. SS1-5]|uniref:DM13 domain-containing protein n=1 Tax=Yoonia rhodophyticola TaxID=3137370 RepID=A0AAN0MA20_9RHOB